MAFFTSSMPFWVSTEHSFFIKKARLVISPGSLASNKAILSSKDKFSDSTPAINIWTVFIWPLSKAKVSPGTLFSSFAASNSLTCSLKRGNDFRPSSMAWTTPSCPPWKAIDIPFDLFSASNLKICSGERFNPFSPSIKTFNTFSSPFWRA